MTVRKQKISAVLGALRRAALRLGFAVYVSFGGLMVGAGWRTLTSPWAEFADTAMALWMLVTVLSARSEVAP